MTGKSQSNIEFILLVALLNAMVAMSIDTMLPAIGTIAAELGATDPNSRQFIITSFFGGMTIGTLVYGPLSDSIGRKPAIYAGLALYAVGSLMCLCSAKLRRSCCWAASSRVSAPPRPASSRSPWCATAVPAPPWRGSCPSS